NFGQVFREEKIILLCRLRLWTCWWQHFLSCQPTGIGYLLLQLDWCFHPKPCRRTQSAFASRLAFAGISSLTARFRQRVGAELCRQSKLGDFGLLRGLRMALVDSLTPLMVGSSASSRQ